MPKKSSPTTPPASLSQSPKITLQQVLPEICNDEFLAYLKSQKDECPDQNQKFLEYLKTGLIILEYKHLVLALRNGYIELLEGIFDQLNFFEKTYLFSHDKVSPKNYNLLHYLADKSNLSLGLQNNPEKISKIANLLLRNYVGINHLDSNGVTPLILAIQLENEVLFSTLLEQPLLIVSHFDFSEKNALDYALELSIAKKDNPQEYLKSINDYFIKLVHAGILIVDTSENLDDISFQRQLDKIDLILDLTFDRKADLRIDEFDKFLLLSIIFFKNYNSDVANLLSLDPKKIYDEKNEANSQKFKFTKKILDSEYFKKLLENFELHKDKFYENFVLHKAIFYLNYDLKKASTELLISGTSGELTYDGDPRIFMDVLESIFSPNSLVSPHSTPASHALKSIFEREDKLECFKKLFSKVFDPNYNVKIKDQCRNFFYWGYISRSLDCINISATEKEIFSEIASLIMEVDFAYYNFFDADRKRDFYIYFILIYKYNNQLFVKKNNGVLVIPLFRPDKTSDRYIYNCLSSELISSIPEINKKIGELKLVSYCFLEEMRGIDIFDFILQNETYYLGKTDLVDFEIRKDSTMFYNSSFGLVSYRGEYSDGKFHGKGALEFQIKLINDFKKYITTYEANLPSFNISPQAKEDFRKCLKKLEKFTQKNYLRYVGEFKNGLFHGQGYLEMTDGSVYQGQFKDGKPNGIGNVFIKKSQGLVHEYKGKFIKGEIVVSTKDLQSAKTTFEKDKGFKRLQDFELKGIQVLKVETEEKTSQPEYKESLKVARFVGDAFAKLYNLELNKKLENELKFIDLKNELSSLIRALKFLESKLEDNQAILEIRQSIGMSGYRDDGGNHLKIFSDQEHYSKTLNEKSQRILKENISLNSRIVQYRQNIEKLQDFIKTSQETLEKGLSLTHNKTEDDQTIPPEKFSVVFDFRFIARRLKLSLDEKMIIDSSQSDRDFIGDLVDFLNSKSLVEKIKGDKLEMHDKTKLDHKLREIFKIDINQELLGELSRSAEDLLREVSAEISASDTSDFPLLGYNSRTISPQKKQKTRPTKQAEAKEVRGLEEGELEEAKEVGGSEEGGLEEAKEALELKAEAEEQQTPSLVARYSLQQNSDLWNLLCGASLQTNTFENLPINHRLLYVDLNNFATGCANIEDEETENLAGLRISHLKQIFHQELDSLIEKIAQHRQYDQQQQTNLKSHIYIHNAYCIGGESLKDCLQKNYQKIFFQGVTGELEGLGHARGANIEELKKSIWTIRKLTKIHNDFQSLTVKKEYPLSIQKFELSLQNKMTLKNQKTEKKYSGSHRLEISDDEEFIHNLCQYFRKNPPTETQTELQEVKDSLIDFLSSGLSEISAQQTIFKDLKQDFIDEAKQIKESPSSDEILVKLLDSQFSILEFLAKETTDKLHQLRETCEKKYSEINKHFQEVEDSKSRQGIRGKSFRRFDGQENGQAARN